MLRLLGMTLILFCFWMLLSGHTEPLLLGLGLFSSLLVASITLRLLAIDHEGEPLSLGWRMIPYWGHLLIDIARANLRVARIILSPSLPVSPGFTRISREQLNDLQSVILANTFTLTPGTITTDINEKTIEIHALTLADAENPDPGGNSGKVLTFTRRQ